MKQSLAVGLGLIISISISCGALYTGNGDSSGGGAIGNGSLNITDNGTTLFFTLNKGGSAGTGFNDVLVLFVDSVPNTGFTDTTHFSDSGNSLKQAISGINVSGSARSTAVFASGFQADYAIAASVDSGGSTYQLFAGGSGSLNFMGSFQLTPQETKTAATYTWSVPWSDLGLDSSSTKAISFEATYITASGSRYLESFESVSGAKGFDQTVTFLNYDSYPIVPVPEPAKASVAIFGSSALIVKIFARVRRRRT